MYDFFNRAIATAKGKSIDSSFIYIENSVIKNHILVHRYILNSSLAVPPNHLIPKLIYSLGLNVNMSNDDIVSTVKNKTNQVSNAFRLTSYTSFGVPLFNTFLDGGAEHIMLTNEDFDTSLPWEQLTPIEFLYHTYTNVNYSLGSLGDQSAIGVIKINLPMLALQYHRWRSWSRQHDAEQTVYHFTVKYPIFNSLKSYMDIAQFNRIYYRIAERPLLKDVPFGRTVPTMNIIPRLDKSALNIIGYLSNKQHTIGQALYTVPVFFQGSALDLVNRLDLYSTKQTEWFDVLYQLPYIHFGLLISKLSGGTLDQYLVSKLIYELKSFINTRGLDTLPKQQSLHIIENFLDPVMDLANSLQ